MDLFSKSKKSPTKRTSGAVHIITLPPTPTWERPSSNRVWAASESIDSTNLAFSELVVDNRLKVLVVGAGFSGLAVAIACARQGFSVTVLERISTGSPHGDNIILGSNAAKILKRWDVGEEFWRQSSHGSWWLFKDDKGENVGAEDLSSFPRSFGAPVLSGHRAKFLGSLGIEARMLGVKIRYETEVIKYHDSRVAPSVVLSSGEIVFADVVVVCDGVNSQARFLLTGQIKKPAEADYSIHRAVMNSDSVREDKQCRHLLDGCIRMWLGDDAHAIVTPLDQGRQISFTFTHRALAGEATLNWRERRPISEVLERLKDWDPVLSALVGKFQSSLNWPISDEKPAQDWISAGGRIVFAGDSRGPMAPSAVQGGSSAIEDGATIAICLALALGSPGAAKLGPPRIKLALRVYEKLRKAKAEESVKLGIKQRTQWHSFKQTRDPAALSLLAKSTYRQDAELDALIFFDSIARDIDKSYTPMSPATVDGIWDATGLNRVGNPDWLVDFCSSQKPAR